MKQRHLGAKYTCTLHPSEGGIAQSVEHVEVASIPKRPYKRHDHFVEFIDGTYASICEHECTSFNGEIAGFLVFNTGSNDGSGETGC